MTALACQQALDAAFRADPAVQATLGNPVRLLDAPIKLAAYPFAWWRRWETKPADAAEVRGEEHVATLEVVSRQSGVEVARAAVEALSNCATSMRPAVVGVRIILVVPLYCDVLRSTDGRSWLGIVRLKIVAEYI